MKDNKEKLTTQFTFRMYNADNIVRFNKFQNELKASGESLSNALENIINDYLERKEKKRVFKDLKVDMEYAFHKALYARMSPFSSNIIKQILNVRAENNLINKKLDILLNMFTSKNSFDRNSIDNPTIELLQESKYFEKMRELLDLENQNNISKQKSKISEVVKREKIFNEYNYDNDTDFGEEYEPIKKEDLYENI